MNRVKWIDYSKGIGIFLVVIGHVNRGLMSFFNDPILNTIDEYVYSFHMPLFFFLAGMFFLSSAAKENFILNKLRVLIYPYVVWSIIQGLIESIFSKYKNTETNILDVFNLLQPRAQFWFLFALMMIFVFTYILHKAKCNMYIILAISIILYFSQSYIGTIFHFDYISHNLIFFALGSIFYYTFNRAHFFKNKLLLYVIFIISCFLLFVFYSENNFIAAILGITMVISLSIILPSNLNLLCKIGTMSMPIYILHIIFGSGLRVVFINILHFQNYYSLLIILTILSTILSMFAYCIMIKLKITKYLF